MTDKDIRGFIGKYKWIFAKTYAATAPHEYYIKDHLDPDGQEVFEEFMMFIRENGFHDF